MNSFNKLIECFRQFPGIGPRQAKRFVYFLLTKDNKYTNEISTLIANLKNEIQICESCFCFFLKNVSKTNTCDICQNTHRNQNILIVVSRDVDFENIEKSGKYNGTYFILGGDIPILEKNPEQRIRIKELLKIIEKRNGVLKEIILAMNINAEGENTEDYLKKNLKSITTKQQIKISTLGRGLSTGTELEYSDIETIKNALENRK